MNFIIKNYLIFVLLGLFIVFALIGYIIDSLRKNNNDNNKQITNTEMNTFNNNIPMTPTNDNGDDLLKTYNETNNNQ